ncbi:MAG TPA: hypothetical protein VF541_16295 [Longimicrobium sp.]
MSRLARLVPRRLAVHPATRGALLALLLISPLLALALPRPARVVGAWERRFGPMQHTVLTSRARRLVRLFPGGRLLASDPPRSYRLDVLGRLDEVVLTGAGVRSLSDVRGLTAFTTLRRLDLSGNPIEGVLDLSAFPHLQILRLRGTRVTQVRGLERMRELRELDLAETPIPNADGLPGLNRLGSLRVLDLSGAQITGALDLSGLRELETLDAPRSGVVLLTGLDASRRLSSVDLSDTPLEWLGLEGVGAAVTVDLSGTRMTNLWALARAPRLHSLSLRRMDLARVEGIEALTQVQEVNLTGSRNVDLSRLGGYRHLRGVLAESTDVRTIEPLRVHRGLISVSVAATPVTDLRPLHDLPELVLVQVPGDRAAAERVRRSFPRPVVVAPAEPLSGAALVSPGTRTMFSLAFRIIPLALLLLFLPLPQRLRTRLVVRYRDVVRFALVSAWAVLMLEAVARVGIRALSGPLHVWARILALALGAAVLLMLALRLVPRLGVGRWAVPCVLLVRRVAQALAFSGTVTLIAALLVSLDLDRLRPTHWNLGTVLFAGIGFVPGLVFVWVRSVLPLRAWNRSRARLAAVTRGDPGKPVVVEVRFRFAAGARSNLRLMLRDQHRPVHDDLHAKQPVQCTPCFALEPAMLRACPVGPGARARLHGVVVHLDTVELEFAHPAELSLLLEWVRAVHRHTAAPVWFVGDWVGRLGTPSPARAAARPFLAALGPLLSGYEYSESLLDSSVLDHLPASVLETLWHNQRTRLDALDEIGLRTLLNEAFTPVAATARSVFGTPELADRVRLLVETVERAVSFFALALAAEWAAGGEREGGSRLARSVAWSLERPDFGRWIGLLDAFRRGGRTPLSATIGEWLDAPYPAGKELTALDRVVSRAGGTMEPPAPGATRRRALDVVREARNLLSAHGSLADPGAAYGALLPVAVRLAASLPWSAAVLVGRGAGDGPSAFRGAVPRPAPAVGAAEGSDAPALLIAGGDGAPTLVPARPYFDVGRDGGVALHAGAGMMLDVVSGLHVEAAHA